ncbi:glycoside hydrolase family 88 protein [Parabacteroides pacaensis]|uniref:glycoside hydrolase family 88 protein n=1 Tax=Parabacteroides pacaensis TaxID=2086575 RepID=UPI000D0FA3AA|nr:glycoside hydrolase family 88 protein [Parabacteroides pacaensis]
MNPGKLTILFLVALITVALFPVTLPAKGKIKIAPILRQAANQYLYLKDQLKGTDRFPQTYDKHMQRLKTSNSEWWCSGFYPGTLFYLYQATGNKDLYNEGIRMLRLLEPQQYNTHTHDVGFMMYGSYGNANRIVPQPEYKAILINSARSLMTRFNSVVGCIKSHNRKPDDYVVIIDNMMNLELLFWATQVTGDSTFYHAAVKHADTTLKNHFRPDNSLYHGLNYNPRTGQIKHYQAGQGFSEKSAWARGQAWGLYGYTLLYRCTQDRKYLDQAVKIAEFILNHPHMPGDLIPYWDYNAPGIPDALRDASAAAINCSALLELSRYVPKAPAKKYFKAAEKILRTLSSPEYTAQPGTNGGFILKHSVGNMPSGTEIDVPLTYADYYYVEALCRYAELTGDAQKQ